MSSTTYKTLSLSEIKLISWLEGNHYEARSKVNAKINSLITFETIQNVMLNEPEVKEAKKAEMKDIWSLYDFC